MLTMKTTIVCGLLGAGKTTYLQNALRNTTEKVVVIVNDFGSVGIDQEILSAHDIEAARKGLKRVKTILSAGVYQVVILEEANIATKYGLFSVQDLLSVKLAKPDTVELVITGRGASPRIIENADLVTEMKAVKHYYQKGIRARIGIEK